MARSRALADRSLHDMTCLCTFTRQSLHADGVVAGLQAMGKANSRMHAQRNLSKMPAAVFISCCSGQWFSKLVKTSCGRSSCRAASHGKGKLKNAKSFCDQTSIRNVFFIFQFEKSSWQCVVAKRYLESVHVYDVVPHVSQCSGRIGQIWCSRLWRRNWADCSVVHRQQCLRQASKRIELVVLNCFLVTFEVCLACLRPLPEAIFSIMDRSSFMLALGSVIIQSTWPPLEVSDMQIGAIVVQVMLLVQ